MASKKATGISKVHYALYDESKGTFEKPVAIPDVETLAISETFAEGSNYADNIRNIYIKTLTGADVSLEFSNISRATEAALTGQSYANGELSYNVAAGSKTVALLFEKTYSDETVDRIVYYNVKLSKDSENGETKTDSFNFQGAALSGVATPLKDGTLKYVISEADLPADGVPGSDEYKVNTRFLKFFEEVMFKGKDATTPRGIVKTRKAVEKE